MTTTPLHLSQKALSSSHHYHIIGAGPVGLATALLLSKHGYTSTVYEGRPSIQHILHESYPIGINARSLHTLAAIHPQLKQDCIDTGMIVDAWEIYGGRRKVAEMQSGCVYGTSRGKVNILLAEEAMKDERITIRYNYRLKDINFTTKQLVFDEYLVSDGTSNKREVIVDVPEQTSKIIAADGCNSKARASVVEHDHRFKAIVTPWKNEFRVLFGPVGQTVPDLNPRAHYIFSGCYSATVKTSDNQLQWTLCLGARDDCSEEDRNLLLSTDPSPRNISALRAYIARNAPHVTSLFSDDNELAQYFTRRTFRGAVVSCNQSNVDEWIVLIGDAAHSLLPPTGEGINSGLEDAFELVDSIRSNPATAFSSYSNKRQKDISALCSYASYINEGWDLSIPGESGARLTFMILESILKRTGIFKSDINSELFGPKSVQRIPYSEIVGQWANRKRILLPLARLIIYPFAWTFWILMLPFTLSRMTMRLFSLKGSSKHSSSIALKPPIAL